MEKPNRFCITLKTVTRYQTDLKKKQRCTENQHCL